MWLRRHTALLAVTGRRPGDDADTASNAGFGESVTIEQQRIAGPAAHRPVVQPRVAVADAPEGNAVDDVPMLDAKTRNRSAYRSASALLQRVGKPRGVRVRGRRLLWPARRDVGALVPRRAGGSTSTSSSVMLTFTPARPQRARSSSRCCATLGQSILSWLCEPTAWIGTPAACSVFTSATAPLRLRRIVERVVVVVELAQRGRPRARTGTPSR